jgi:hypothetical protein
MTENASNPDTQRIYQYVAMRRMGGLLFADGGWPGSWISGSCAVAADSGVRIWLWEHRWIMADPREAEEKMRLWKSWGVGGSDDFFESDRRNAWARYDMW